MPRKLSYFKIKGYAEPIRYMLHYGKLEFEDVRYSDWPIPEVKAELPYGQMPVYEKDGQVLNQSLAIARYVASEVGLLPSDVWKQAQLDAIALTIYDFFKKIRPMLNNKDQNEVNKKEKEETLEYFLSRFEKELKAGNGHFGGQLNWADFILAVFMDILSEHIGQLIEKDYPTIFALISKVQSLPGVKEYIS